MKPSPAALRIHWLCPTCDRPLAADLSQPYDPKSVRCCKHLFYIKPSTREVFYHRFERSEKSHPGVTIDDVYKTPVKSWNEEN